MFNFQLQRLAPLIRSEIFPIEGFFREYILILEGIIIFLVLQYGIYFSYRFSVEEREKNYMVRAWAIFFFTYASNIVFFIISDFYSDTLYRQIFIDLGYVILGTGGIFFSYYAEIEMNIKNHAFTKIITIMLAILIIDTIFPVISPGLLAVLTNVIFIALLIVYVIKFTSNIKEKWRINIYGFILGICIWVFGYCLIIDFLVEAIGPISRFVGDIFIVTGMSLISLVFIGLPSLTEFDWPDKMKKLFIMYKTGSYISDVDFQEEFGLKDEYRDLPQFITGGLAGIDNLLKEIVKTKEKLLVIDHKDLKIIFHHGNFLIAAIIVDEELDIFKTKLKKLIDYLETLYESLLPHWDGDLAHFKIVKPIIKNFFT